MHNLQFIRSNRMFSWYLLLPLATCLVASAWCQEGKSSGRPTPPPGILLSAPPEFSQWTVTCSYPQDHPSRAETKHLAVLDPNLVRKVAITKTREIIHEETVSVSGDRFDKWQNSSKYYIKPQGQSYWGECDANLMKNNVVSDARLLPLPTNKFRGLEWIDGKTYAGSL